MATIYNITLTHKDRNLPEHARISSSGQILEGGYPVLGPNANNGYYTCPYCGDYSFEMPIGNCRKKCDKYDPSWGMATIAKAIAQGVSPEKADLYGICTVEYHVESQ